jgi:hypothetical protein
MLDQAGHRIASLKCVCGHVAEVHEDLQFARGLCLACDCKIFSLAPDTPMASAPIVIQDMSEFITWVT